MEIIIVRHGLSEANKQDFVGGPDTPLAEEGLKQADELAERLAGLDIDAVYSSTMKRAKDTALPLARKLNKEIICDKRLGEVDFGSFAGKPHPEMEKVVGKTPRELFDSYSYDLSAWGGETSKEVETRVKSFLNDLRQQPYKLVVLVCHGGIVRWLNYLITGEKISWQPNAEELYLKNE